MNEKTKKTSNRSLNQARDARQDEFYTRLDDISNEVRHYKKHLHGKVVLCNCDDPYESNFFRYFALNFKTLGLKKLIATSYLGSPVAGQTLPLFEIEGLKLEGKDCHAIEINEVPDGNEDGAIDLTDVEILLRNDANVSYPLKGDATYGPGDFRSSECVELLKRSDVVITNPPFSLFREYVAQLVEHGKEFLIIGSKNAITYKEIFPLIITNKMWMGTGFSAGNAYFKIPPENAREFASGVYDHNTGLVKFRNVGWFTNLDHKKRHEEVPLFKKYNEKDYPSYVNYPDAIEVSKVSEIPVDYGGLMGVPITFLDKYNPDQFEIVGSSRGLGVPMQSIAPKGSFIQGGPRFYLANGDSTYRRMYDRIVIRKKT